jgi:predicted metal-dependent peptidase
VARKKKTVVDPYEAAFDTACAAVASHPLFQPLYTDMSYPVRDCVTVRWDEDETLNRDRGWARVHANGTVVANKHARGDPAEWIWVLAHCLLHLGLGHLDSRQPADPALALARCVVVTRFQQSLKLGRSPYVVADLPSATEEQLAERWRVSGIPAPYESCNVAGAGVDVSVEPDHRCRHCGTGSVPPPLWTDRFAVGLAEAASAALDAAAAPRFSAHDAPRRSAPWELARNWFVSAYPLLAGLAAGFTVVADAELARTWHISVAAVDAAAAEIYVNPLANLTDAERRFVVAHEMLHAALRHGDRVGPREAYLWNVATDYVINGWLVEMAVGELPDGVLYDPALAGMSAEEVYDRLATDLRRLRKLATLRGQGLGDILHEPLSGHRVRGVDLDEYYRRALACGLALHESGRRGTLPASLVDEIRALDQPPLPWDAQLARWFEEHVPALEKRRSYARPSRRQAASPGIPRPGWRRPEELVARPTFGVVLDTSGSMDRTLLGKGLGAIASYATARDVPAARVVFCDAAAYDAGYLPVEEIAGRVRVRGRGGTVLQPGVQLLERADDFPPTAPILVITDGYCDVVRVRREHAFLVPEGARLPFRPLGPVFRMS